MMKRTVLQKKRPSPSVLRWVTVAAALLQADMWPPKAHVLKPQPPAPWNETVFGDKGLKEVIKLKCGHRDGA